MNDADTIEYAVAAGYGDQFKQVSAALLMIFA
jgi:hypothetical protein